MGGILLLAGFELAGVLTVWNPARERSVMIRVYLGLTAGLVMMMWLPALTAFLTGFTLFAQLAGLLAAFVIGVCVFFAARKKPAGAGPEKEMPLWLLIALTLPLIILAGYLLSTHTLRPVDGSYHCGQSTYGDLNLHLAIATSLRNASFPPTYNLIQGVELGYPFLSDSLATSMLLCGSSLRLAFAVSGTLMMALVFAGFALFTYEITGSRAAAAAAQALMFFNGGFGFLYMIDGIGGNQEMFREIFTGFYKTPTNYNSLNLRWSNVIADMMVPQRTLLAGWTVLIPCLFLLACALKRPKTKTNVCLGILAGSLPLIHTHTYLALALLSLGAFISALIRSGDRKSTLRGFIVYGMIAAALGLPQALKWSVPQTVNGGSLRLLFNWVNNSGSGLIDEYFFFWVKNVGVVYLCAIPAVLTADKKLRALGLGALLIYIVAEFIVFQPNAYDNNKLFYVAYIAVTPLAAHFIVKVFFALRGLRVRVGLLVLVLVCGTLSGVLTLGRECVSDYQLFGRDLVAAAEYIDAGMPGDSVFLTGNQHINPVSSLAGRQIVCGPNLYLYFHGIDTSGQTADVTKMYEDPSNSMELFENYGVDYVYISSYEENNYDIDLEFFENNAEKVYSEGEVTIYRFNADD